PDTLNRFQYADFTEGPTPQGIAKLMGGLNAIRISPKEIHTPENPKGVPAQAQTDAKPAPATTTTAAQPISLGEVNDALEDKDYERALWLIQQLESSTASNPRLARLLIPLKEEAEEGLKQQTFAREAAYHYAPIAEMVKRERTRKHGCAEFLEFQQEYPGYDPDDLAKLCGGSAPKAFVLPPPFEWIEIPAGRVTLVPDETDKKESYLKQTTTFDIPAFAIAKYPVTNEQFQVFVDAADGYIDPKWWDYSPDAAAWRKGNPAPQKPAFPGDDHPRANVTWYEAVAFCRWLSQKTGQTITLPTEQQWQRAAQGDTAWAYPWGNDWDNGTRCNNSVSPNDSKSTTPVTHYEGEGDSPFKVADMAGNVWEWCLTEYNTGENKINGTNVRVLRGGSWRLGNTYDFRVGFRNWGNPDYWNNVRGFRLVRS
ncbi:MAG: SUMF1/EgtB/PvdO family nonheme iron enzyme, partial [bacterium]|nr:SUMF1/EgtB/PvdO family nonheme iron enzyme [bacterium]